MLGEKSLHLAIRMRFRVAHGLGFHRKVIKKRNVVRTRNQIKVEFNISKKVK